ncbi:MAG: ATP-binding protein [Acidobacteriota bacterium]
MTFRIITADERMSAPRSIKGVIFGPHKIGKTSLLWTLDPKTTLFLNLEAGELAIQGWSGDTIEISSWKEARNLACLASGPDLSLEPDAQGNWPVYSKPHYDAMVQQYPGLVEQLAMYETHFWDSISVASRMAWKWAIGQPGSFSEKTGKQDTRGTYRIIGQEIVSWLTRIQHTKGKSIWVVGGLDEIKDEFNRPYWSPQIEGSKAGRELLGIFDQVVSMVNLPSEEGQPYRAFVCHQTNPWGFPAGDRSGRLDLVEKPHLGELMDKISGPVRPASERLTYQMPINEGE